jgi:hypothetical protein
MGSRLPSRRYYVSVPKARDLFIDKTNTSTYLLS